MVSESMSGVMMEIRVIRMAVPTRVWKRIVVMVPFKHQMHKGKTSFVMMEIKIITTDVITVVSQIHCVAMVSSILENDVTMGIR